MDSILSALGLGLLASTSPCILPLYPGYLAYIAGLDGEGNQRGRHFLGFFVLAGVMSMMLLLGLLIALLSVSVSRALTVVIPLADLMIIGLGVLLLLDKNPFKALPQVKIPALRNRFLNAYIYGFLYGPIALPCSGPLVVGIFAISLTAGEALSKLSVFFWFGIGFGIPLLLLSLLSGVLQRKITLWFARHSRWVNLAGGILLVGIGLYDLWVNRDLLALGLTSLFSR